MPHAASVQTEEFILMAFAAANPIYCFDLWNNGNPALAAAMTRFLGSPEHTPQLWGNKERIIRSRKQIEKHVHRFPLPSVKPVYHVFPVYSKPLAAGFMMPLDMVFSQDWEISDAFGTFGYGRTDISALQVFQNLLKRMEEAWIKSNPGQTLPLRWRNSLSLKLLCPLHFNVIQGKSLQAPLAIAVLRALTQAPSTQSPGFMLPFGNHPVFASGTLNSTDGAFGEIKHLDEKLKAFIREYGSGLPAVFTTKQILDLQASNSSLLDQVSVFKANNLGELMELDAMKPFLAALCNPPHVTEIDSLLNTLVRLQRSIRFKDVEDMASWLAPHIQSPVYRFQLLRHLGLILTHRGQFAIAGTYVEKASKVLDRHIKWFGTVEKIQLATLRGTMAFDACDVSLAEESLNAAEKELPYATAADKARFWGTLCQLYRLNEKKLDLAIDAGYRAIECTDISLASDSGRDRNYLVHALIARARCNAETLDTDLQTAAGLLEASEKQWAPMDSKIAGQVHSGFCIHYRAEIARLENRPFGPPDSQPCSGFWSHAWMFTLLSCSRNRQNSHWKRITYANKLAAVAERYARKNPESVFEMLSFVYLLYRDAITGNVSAIAFGRLRNWCSKMKSLGYPGWDNRLFADIGSIVSAEHFLARGLDAVEELCDAIPYH